MAIEVEEAVNRRPLTTTADGRATLTPAHFLNGLRPAEDDPLPPLDEIDLREEWGKLQKFSAACFRTLKQEYLTQLRSWRVQQRDPFYPTTDEVVLVEEKGKPRIRWPMGRVLRVRRNDVDILIRGKTTRRAVRDLYPLECATIRR